MPVRAGSSPPIPDMLCSHALATLAFKNPFLHGMRMILGYIQTDLLKVPLWPSRMQLRSRAWAPAGGSGCPPGDGGQARGWVG